VSKAVVLVTHDRYFLSRITNHIVDLENGHLYQYDGNYADYLEQREVRREQAEAVEQKRQSFLRTEVEWIRAGAQARSTKQKSRIERFEKIAAMDAPKEKNTLELKSANTRLGGNTVKIEHISKAYGDKTLFTDFSYTVRRMDRLGIIGENGCGKSTLLKIIMGLVQPDTGSIKVGETVKFGYFAQQNDVFKKDQRVIDYLKEFGSVVYTADHEPITASQMLEHFLFFKDDQYKPIAKCSGGEKRRLYLCSILMTAPNILVLDEPTNDLDTDTLTILENYLENFHGAVLAVSHDRYFLDKAVDHLLVFEHGRIAEKQQSYSDYLEADADHKEAPAAPVKVKEKKVSNKLSYQEKRELEALEKELPEMEQEVHELEERLNQASAFKDIQEIDSLLEAKRKELEEKETRWMELADRAE
jgi:ATP-binding cassette subfamily F protein uup